MDIASIGDCESKALRNSSLKMMGSGFQKAAPVGVGSFAARRSRPLAASAFLRGGLNQSAERQWSGLPLFVLRTRATSGLCPKRLASSMASF